MFFPIILIPASIFVVLIFLSMIFSRYIINNKITLLCNVMIVLFSIVCFIFYMNHFIRTKNSSILGALFETWFTAFVIMIDVALISCILLLTIGILKHISGNLSNNSELQYKQREIEKRYQEQLFKSSQKPLFEQREKELLNQQIEELRRQKLLDQKKTAEQTKLQVQVPQTQKVSDYKLNWQEFQQVFQNNGVDKLYHFTDRANLPSIIDNDGLLSWWEAEILGIKVNKPGGIGFGRELDKLYGLENYVRLCFTRQHPMMFVAQREGRINDPIILEIDIRIAYLKETRFSNMNATKNGHSQGKEIENLRSIKFDIGTVSE